MEKSEQYYQSINPKTGEPVEDQELEYDYLVGIGWFQPCLVRLCRWIIRTLYPTAVTGLENIPTSGSVIFAYSHIGLPDAILAMATARQPAYFLAKIELFHTPLLGWLVRQVGGIPVDRNRRNSQSLALAEDLLKNGAALVIFPEGTYSRNGQILPLKYGAVALSKKTGAPIVPVVATGRYRLCHRDVRAEVLKPIQPRGNLDQMNRKLHQKMSLTRQRQLAESSANLQETHHWLQSLLRYPVRWLIRLLYRPTVVGAANLPKTGGLVLAANHKHVLDQFLPELALSSRQRPTYFAKIEYTKKLIGRLMRHYNVVFVDRAADDKSPSIAAANRKLQRGDSLIIFPEGTRNKSKKLLLPFRYGAVSFAYHNKIPLVPVAIVGQWRLFGSSLKVVFGRPLTVQHRSDYPKANKKLYNDIKQMLIAGGETSHRPVIYKHYQQKGQK